MQPNSPSWIESSDSQWTYNHCGICLEQEILVGGIKQRVSLAGHITIRNSICMMLNFLYSYATTLSWSLDFIIKTATDGALRNGCLDIDVEYPTNFFSASDWKGGKGNVDYFDGDNAIKTMKTKLKENLDELKAYIEGTVKEVLKQSQFVLAGSGYFTMHNPVFTTKGDLLVEIDYKG